MHCWVEQRELLWCQVPQVYKSDRIHNRSYTLILEIPPQEMNPKGTCTKTFKAAMVINSKKLEWPNNAIKGLAQQGRCSPEKASLWATSTHRWEIQESVMGKEWTKHSGGAWLPTGLTCTQRLDRQTWEGRNKSQIFIRAGLLKLESAFKLCGQFIRMQILAQEVWGGISFCTSKGVPRWRPRGHDRSLGSEALNLFLDSKLSSSFQKNNPVSDPQREAKRISFSPVPHCELNHIPQKRYAQTLTCKCELIWNQDLGRYNQVKMRS